MVSPIEPAVGNGVIHLFCKPTLGYEPESLVAAVRAAEAAGTQVVTVALLGHKADLAIMAIAKDLRRLRALQTAVCSAPGWKWSTATSASPRSASTPRACRRRCLEERMYPRHPAAAAST
jgi:hypothetical protein